MNIKKSNMARLLGVLALLASSASMSATVTITPSLGPNAIAGEYNVGDIFTLTVTSDAGNTFAATMALSFDATKVAYLSGSTLSPWTVYTKNTPPTENPTVFDIEAPSAMAASPATYNAAVLTFQALAVGSANIIIDDDGGTYTGWFDATTADYIPSNYIQADVNIVPVPAAVWLFASALGGLATLRRRDS